MYRLRFSFALTMVVALAAAGGLALAQTQAFWPKDAQVYFIEPVDGATVSNPVQIKFGLKGAGVAPAGVDKAATGHHHVFIDSPLPADLEEAVSLDEKHLHFGGGQTETSVKLAPGKHTLQLLLGDKNHIPHNPPLASKKITITVKNP
jgi:hypothetical protein